MRLPASAKNRIHENPSPCIDWYDIDHCIRLAAYLHPISQSRRRGVHDPAEQGIIRLFQSTKKPGGGVNLAATPAHVLENVGATHMMKSYPSAEGQ